MQFTIVAYGKSWYIEMYHAQSDLVWNSQYQGRLKTQKVLKLKTNMADTRWLNFLYSTLWKNVKVQYNDKIKFWLNLFFETMCFSNPREMSFSDPLTGLRLWGLTYSFLGSKERLQLFPLSPGWLDTVLGLLALGITWAAPEDPWPHGSTSLPGWSFPAPRKHYAHEEGWVALGTIFGHFQQFLTQTGRMLLVPYWAPNVTGCLYACRVRELFDAL